MSVKSLLILTALVLCLGFVIGVIKTKSPVEKQFEIENKAAATRVILDKLMAGEAIPVSKVWFVDERGFVDQGAVKWIQRSTNLTWTKEELDVLGCIETVRVIRQKRPARY